MRPLLPRSDAIVADNAVERLAVGVLRQAIRDGDAEFFTDGPMLTFWCDCAGLRVDAVQACYRRTVQPSPLHRDCPAGVPQSE